MRLRRKNLSRTEPRCRLCPPVQEVPCQTLRCTQCFARPAHSDNDNLAACGCKAFTPGYLVADLATPRALGLRGLRFPNQDNGSQLRAGQVALAFRCPLHTARKPFQTVTLHLEDHARVGRDAFHFAVHFRHLGGNKGHHHLMPRSACPLSRARRHYAHVVEPPNARGAGRR